MHETYRDECGPLERDHNVIFKSPTMDEFYLYFYSANVTPWKIASVFASLFFA
jgi:hypothetical protein